MIAVFVQFVANVGLVIKIVDSVRGSQAALCIVNISSVLYICLFSQYTGAAPHS